MSNKGLNTIDGPFGPTSAVSSKGVVETLEHCPVIPFLEDSHYYLKRESKEYDKQGVLRTKAVSYVNDNLGLLVTLVWPDKAAQVFIEGRGQVSFLMETLYKDPDFLKKYLIDASQLVAANPNQR